MESRRLLSVEDNNGSILSIPLWCATYIQMMDVRSARNKWRESEELGAPLPAEAEL